MSVIAATINCSKELVEFSALIPEYLKFYYVILIISLPLLFDEENLLFQANFLSLCLSVHNTCSTMTMRLCIFHKIFVFFRMILIFFAKFSFYFFSKFLHYFLWNFRIIFHFFAFSISWKFRIFSRNRLKRNFANKAKNLAFFVSELNAKT